ncbi:MAG: hypothetical protein ABI412_05630 [Sphingomicrobium sp.]
MLRFMLAALALGSAPVSAAWHRASSSHFVIYADEDPETLRAFAQKLERFDKAVRTARGMKDPRLGDDNRLTVYVVADSTAVTKLHHGSDSSVAGFYRSRAVNAHAVVPRKVSKQAQITPDVVFFHEYAHHLMFQDFTTPMPSWLVEGFAEFYGMADVYSDGSVGLGGAPVHRGRTLRQKTNPLPFTQMLGGANPSTGMERNSLYARGWLLTHYLTFSKQRSGQLEAYLNALARGIGSADAARQAFGNVDQLEVETEKYLQADKFPYLTLPASSLPIGIVNVASLGVGGDAIMPLRLRLAAGADENKAALAAKIREVAGRYPVDALVQLTLAEAEFADGRNAAARLAGQKALSLDDKSVPAMVLIGQAVMADAKAKVAGATFAEARGWFNRANRLDPENPAPLLMFYNSFVAEGVTPTHNAISAMRYAAALAPQDLGLRLLTAKSLIAEGKKAEARIALIPIAYYPHGGRPAEEARRLLDLAAK